VRKHKPKPGAEISKIKVRHILLEKVFSFFSTDNTEHMPKEINILVASLTNHRKY